MQVRKPKIDYTGSPLFATHDMACAICRSEKAVLNLKGSGDYFDPCWKCQDKGWKIVSLTGWRKLLLRLLD